MKGSWGLYGHRPRPDSKEWVTNRMGGAPGPCQRQRPNVSPRGGWKQAEHVEKSGKEADVLVSARSPSRGCLDQVLSPRGTPALPHQGCFSPRAARSCRGQGLWQAGWPLSLALGIPLPHAHWERRWGCAEGLLPPSAVGTCLARVPLTFPLAPSWMKAQTGW